MTWFKISIEVYYDSNSVLSKYHIYDKWIADFGELTKLYSDNIFKEKIIKIVKDIDISKPSNNYSMFTITLSEEEFFYIQLKYESVIGYIDYQQIQEII